jgi:hypothetical protein
MELEEAIEYALSEQEPSATPPRRLRERPSGHYLTKDLVQAERPTCREEQEASMNHRRWYEAEALMADSTSRPRTAPRPLRHACPQCAGQPRTRGASNGILYVRTSCGRTADESLRVRGTFGEENLVCHPVRTSTR